MKKRSKKPVKIRKKIVKRRRNPEFNTHDLNFFIKYSYYLGIADARGNKESSHTLGRKIAEGLRKKGMNPETVLLGSHLTRLINLDKQ